MKETLLWLPGAFTIEYAGRRWTAENRITNPGLAWFIDLWRAVGVPGFKHIALGTSAAATLDDQETLGEEVIRKPIHQFNAVPPLLESVVAFEDDEANVIINEIGVFAGAGASLLPNTGILVARAVVYIDKQEHLGTLRVIREDRLGRA